jgi:hypothetical protein
MKANYKKYVVGALLLLALGVLGILWQRPNPSFGSTVDGNDYFATSTRTIVGTSNVANHTVLKSTGGAVARVTITGANTGIIRLWNATTTNVTLRKSATTSLQWIEIPASAAANTYDFDAVFSDGILYELVSGNAPTSTIVWR